MGSNNWFVPKICDENDCSVLAKGTKSRRRDVGLRLSWFVSVSPTSRRFLPNRTHNLKVLMKTKVLWVRSYRCCFAISGVFFCSALLRRFLPGNAAPRFHPSPSRRRPPAGSPDANGTPVFSTKSDPLTPPAPSRTRNAQLQRLQTLTCSEKRIHSCVCIYTVSFKDYV